ncbi:MAG TPA: nucleoside triphosphate pyrophosphatase [Stellaceae bacterium]|nr:nucleoside triphosphate pyrophosphatase [Stellaceae bacterium]
MAKRREPIVLASASAARAGLLHAAGIDFAVDPAAIDEAPLKQEARAAGEGAVACATLLATEKARHVSRRRPDALVIGADQLLACGDEWFDKPADLAAAAVQLRELRGRTHRLATAVCVAHADLPLWRAASEPELTMRPFSDAFLDDYLRQEGEALCAAVGAYRIEGLGIQLFSRISGDRFAVMGLPLLELLEYLRRRGAISS